MNPNQFKPELPGTVPVETEVLTPEPTNTPSQPEVNPGIAVEVKNIQPTTLPIAPITPTVPSEPVQPAQPVLLSENQKESSVSHLVEQNVSGVSAASNLLEQIAELQKD